MSKPKAKFQSTIDPDDTEDFADLTHRHLVCRFVGRQGRLARLQELKVPQTVLEMEQALIQKSYNQMRDKCLQDEEFMAIWGEYFKDENN